MGSCVSSYYREAHWQQQLSQETEKQIEDSRRRKKEYKVLLFGSDESCKSAIVQQMKTFQQNDFTPEKPTAFRTTYVPNETDSPIQCQHKSTGIITETQFDLVRFSLRLFDVSSDYFTHQHWSPCFEDVTSIIFCTALSECDQVVPEEPSKSLMLFDSVVNSRSVRRASIILFFTQVDVFNDKLRTVPLRHYFPDYTGGTTDIDIDEARKYILRKFMTANRAGLSVYQSFITQEFGAVHPHGCARYD